MNTDKELSGIDAPLIGKLIAMQFPDWKNLSVRPVELSGHDNRTFHLGDSMLVRLPSSAEYSQQVEKEQKWLPKLAPLLPLAIPTPLAIGAPAFGYPWHWSIYQWLEGENAAIERIADLRQFAVTLAQFLMALQHIDTTDGPLPGAHNFFRGGPLTVYDKETRQAIKDLGDEIEVDSVTAVWEEAIASTWQNLPVWVHGDVSAGNLLVKDCRLSAVIDFGCLAVGDPACDLSIAWTLLEKESRKVFRKTLAIDDETWARGRGWTLWKALITLAKSYRLGFSDEAGKSRQILEKILRDAN